jgi:thiamine biosynthesis lipoprotein
MVVPLVSSPTEADAVPWLQRAAGGWRGGFDAMASPCEVLVDGVDEATARRLVALAQDEALRIERRFSRYRDDSVVARLRAARGGWQWVDDETAQLLDFAAKCHALSGGLFDITSGVLRSAWRFDGSDRVPTPAAVAALLPRVGWQQLRWQRPRLWLPEGMELDFGGIGKEYAVDRTLARLGADTPAPMLVNFGGDLACSGPRADGSPWQVGIEQPGTAAAATVLNLRTGALATSGDARRFVLHQGRRLGHVLDPRTGWPVEGAPRSVTVSAPSCVEAGMVATMALLQGAGAAAWLRQTGVPHALIDEQGVLQAHFDYPQREDASWPQG